MDFETMNGQTLCDYGEKNNISWKFFLVTENSIKKISDFTQFETYTIKLPNLEHTT